MELPGLEGACVPEGLNFPRDALNFVFPDTVEQKLKSSLSPSVSESESLISVSGGTALSFLLGCAVGSSAPWLPAVLTLGRGSPPLSAAPEQLGSLALFCLCRCF